MVRWTKDDNDYLYIYGGSSRGIALDLRFTVVRSFVSPPGWSSDRMYRYDIKLRQWERITPVGEPLHVSGDHSGVVYKDHMLVFG